MALPAKARCPGCHTAFNLDRSAGHRQTCPACGKVLRLSVRGPASGSTNPTSEEAMAPAAHSEPSTSASWKEYARPGAEAPAGKLGRFVLLSGLGRGAFGEVWRAYDPHLDREVALKVPRFDDTAGNEAQRFFREASAAAQLQHPHIVPVYDAGQAAGRFYIASKYIDGTTLAAWLQEHRPTLAETCQLVRTLAEALQHAHTQGIFHRDVKPGNVMIDKAGAPHLMDFGLARRPEHEATMTTEGAILGTPSYMAPEQALGHGHQVDARSDLYSLGVVLYELLTGRRPFEGPVPSLLLKVVNEEPTPPRQVRPGIPRDLETICLKCLAKEPDQRYADCQTLADELGRFQAGEPLRARPVGPAARVWRWCRRHPGFAGAAALVVVCLGAVAGMAMLLLRPAPPPLVAEQAPRGAATAPTAPAAPAAPPSLVWSSPPGTTWWWCACYSPRGDYLAAGEDPRPNPDPSIMRIRLWPLKNGLPSGESFLLKHALPGHKLWQTGMAFSADGARLASAANEGSIFVWNLNASPPIELGRFLRLDGIVTGIAFSPDGRYLAAGARKAGSPVYVWDLSDPSRATEAFQFTPKEEGEISALAFSVDATTLYIGTGKKDVGGKIYAWEYQAGGPGRVLWSRPPNPASPWVRSLDVSRDGTQLGLTYADEAHIIDPKTGALRVTLNGHLSGQAVQGIAFAADGTRCVTAGYDKTARAWSTRDGKQIWQNDVLTGMNEGISISADGRFAFTSSHLVGNNAGNVVQLWRLPEPPPDEGFTALFNGRDFAGWTEAPAWKVQDGAACAAEEPLATLQNDYWNYVLRLEWQAQPAAKGRIFLSGPRGAGILYLQDEKSTPNLVWTPLPAGQWNSLEVRCQANRAFPILNGVPAAPKGIPLSASRRPGPLGLAGAGVKFRKVLIKVLD